MCLQSLPCNFLVCVSGCNVKREREEGGEVDNCLAKNNLSWPSLSTECSLCPLNGCTVGHMQRHVSLNRLRENASTKPLHNRAEMIDWFPLSSIVIVSGERSRGHGVISIGRERGKVGRCGNRWEHKKRDKREWDEVFIEKAETIGLCK